jgi:hypothetical protein
MRPKLVLLSALFVSTPVLAQGVQPVPMQPVQPVQGQPQPAPGQPAPQGQPPVVVVQAPGAPPAAPAAAQPDGGRLWIGFNINGGVGSGANLSGPAFGGTFRIGYVLSEMYGIYANITPIVWVGSASSESTGGVSVSLSAIDGILLNPMFALTPVDVFEVAAGPSIDYLTGGSASATTTTAAGGSSTVSAGGFSSVYFGIDGRLALHLGGRNETSGRRRGFTLSGDVHPSFVTGGPVIFYTIGLGADWF